MAPETPASPLRGTEDCKDKDTAAADKCRLDAQGAREGELGIMGEQLPQGSKSGEKGGNVGHRSQYVSGGYYKLAVQANPTQECVWVVLGRVQRSAATSTTQHRKHYSKSE